MISEDYKIPNNLAQRITADQAFHYRIVPIADSGQGMVLKTDTESLENLLAELQIVLDAPVVLQPCQKEELQKYLSTNYRQSQKKETGQLSYTADFLEKILLDAKHTGSSDIHFEPYEKRCRVRFRLDGKLIEQFNIPLDDYPTIINKIKIKADLDIAEKRLPQDGRISINTEGTEFDIRVSSLPTLHGEKLVLRILSKDTGALDLEALGFTEKELKRYKEGIRNPNGIILISGPTGSGKTTTLYATLKHLNNEESNILTVEDPIEYTLEGINQVQLKESIGLDFSSTLRTFLRPGSRHRNGRGNTGCKNGEHGHSCRFDRTFGALDHSHQFGMGHHLTTDRYGRALVLDRQHLEYQRGTTPGQKIMRLQTEGRNRKFVVSRKFCGSQKHEVTLCGRWLQPMPPHRLRGPKGHL